MMGRIEAGERLAAINDRSVASGFVEPHDRRRHLGRLERRAQGVSARAAKASPAVLAGMGIGVVSVPSGAPKKAVSDG